MLCWCVYDLCVWAAVLLPWCTSGDETELTHLQPIHNGEQQQCCCVHFVMRKNALRWNGWIVRDITHLRSVHYTSLTQCKTHTHSHKPNGLIYWMKRKLIDVYLLPLYLDSIAEESNLPLQLVSFCFICFHYFNASTHLSIFGDRSIKHFLTVEMFCGVYYSAALFVLTLR